jgi:hypothetical protein
MRGRIVRLFGALIAIQAAHSLEEYAGRLWEVLPPARLASSLVSSDLERGFIVINVTIAGLGLASLLGPIRGGWRSGPAVAWGWAVMETLNGAAHVAIALWQGGYAPGVATAPLLIGTGVLLMRASRR